jgi:hypothetical protein
MQRRLLCFVFQVPKTGLNRSINKMQNISFFREKREEKKRISHF